MTRTLGSEGPAQARAGASALALRLGADLRVALLLGAAHALLSIVAGARDTYLNNEGIFTYLFARMIADDPLPVAFLLKSRPPIAALYALPSALGFPVFLVAHSLVAAAAIPLTAVLARAAGQRYPNVAAALVAASPLLLAGGASGVGNSDGATLGVLAAALLFAWDRPALAGIVAAILPLARSETSSLVAVLALHAVLVGGRARRMFLPALAAPLVVFALLGAAYHQDLLWLLHHPPHVTHTVPFSQVVGPQLFGGEPHRVTLTLLMLTPAIGLLPFLRVRELASPERIAALFAVPFVVLLSVIPALSPLNFGDMPRYVLPSLPFVAILSSRALEHLHDGEASGRASWIAGATWLAVALGIAHVQDATYQAPALLWAVAGWALVALVSATTARSAVPLVGLALCLVAAVPLATTTRLSLTPDTVALGRYLIEHADPETPVLTNVSELPMWLERHGGEHLDVHHMLAADMRYELDTLANERVGQRRALHALLRRHWYGPIVFGEDVEGWLRPGTWLALRDDPRTEHVLPARWLDGRSESVPVDDGVEIVRVER